MNQTVKVRINGEIVERPVAHMTVAIQEDGSHIEYPEPQLDPGEVVFQSTGDPIPIIVVRTTPA